MPTKQFGAMDLEALGKAREAGREEGRLMEAQSKSVFERGLPKLAQQTSNSVKQKNSVVKAEYDVAKLGVFEKGVFVTAERESIGTCTWSDARDGKLGWESEVSKHVSHVLSDLARSLPSSIDRLDFQREVKNKLFGYMSTEDDEDAQGQDPPASTESVAKEGGAGKKRNKPEGEKSKRPDLLVVRAGNFVPCGAVEVKTPLLQTNGDSVLAGKPTLDQLQNYMTGVSHFYGQFLTVGVMTTYNHWRFVFPAACKDLMAATSPDAVETAVRAIRESLVPGGAGAGGELLVTELFEYDRKNIVLVLATGLYKMVKVANIMRGIDDFNMQRGYIALPANAGVSTGKYKHKPKALFVKLEAFLKPLYIKPDWLLVQMCGSGGDGDVWIAVQKQDLEKCKTHGAKLKKDKQLRVLKLFGNGDYATRAAEAEYKVWLKVDEQRADKLKVKPGLADVRKTKALVLPLMKQYPSEQPLDAQNVNEEIARIAKAGYVHDDLVRRHVMVLKGQVVIIDLARVHEEGDWEKAAREMKEALMSSE